jgi:antitoxin component YwqK of YwqJK toxin-antitoxin module
MNVQFNLTSVFTPLIILLLAGSFTYANDFGELNRIDANGQRQGYWIIKGYMIEASAYSANATVEEGHYINGNKEGLWKRYYPSGQVRNEITYRGDLPHGPYIIYYPNGQIEEQSNWQRNKNVGEFKRFYADGTPQQEFYFADNGKRNGEQRYYHDNGQLALVVSVVNGKEEGEMRRYTPEGKLKEVKVLRGGVVEPGSEKKYKAPAPKIENAQPKVETAPKPEAPAEEPEALPILMDDEVQPNTAHRFEPNGFNTLYNKSQQVTQTGTFRNGRLWNGKWYRYNQNGMLVKVEIYQEGRYIGAGVMDEKDN